MKAIVLALATLAFAGAASAQCMGSKAAQEIAAPVVKPAPTS